MKSDNKSGWKQEISQFSLPEVFASISTTNKSGILRKLLAFAGPGLLVAVGYMDPGNWATDIAGGAKFGYTLLVVILVSNIFAMILQHLSLKLGIVAQRDLAQACRHSYSAPVNFMLWILCEIAIAACDLAEVLGSAIALNLLFGIPLFWGVIITVLDVLLILYFQNKGFRIIESIVASLILIIFICFAYEIVISSPSIMAIMGGFVPKAEIIKNPQMLYISIGILGATVMPHNLYLHSSIVQTRKIERDEASVKTAIKYATWDSSISLFLAFFVNAAILILAAATFHNTGYQHIADITDAYKLLDPLLGAKFAGIFFAIALLASGQNSTITGTLAGQIVMEGFLELKLKPWLRRIITRLIAVVPALIVISIYGDSAVADLLVFSQVILSLQLSFAIVPLITFTSDKSKMGNFSNSKSLVIISCVIAAIIISLNAFLLWETIFG